MKGWMEGWRDGRMEGWKKQIDISELKTILVTI